MAPGGVPFREFSGEKQRHGVRRADQHSEGQQGKERRKQGNRGGVSTARAGQGVVGGVPTLEGPRQRCGAGGGEGSVGYFSLRI